MKRRQSRWTPEDASLDGFRAVLDPRDVDGYKNALIDRTHRLAIRRAVAGSGRPGFDVAVDFGCGIGRLTPVLLGVASRSIGLDVHDGYLARARALYGGERTSFLRTDDVRAVEGRALVVCFGVLSHFADDDVVGTLRDLREVVGSDALLLLAERVRRSADIAPTDIDPRDVAWYQRALLGAGWQPRRVRAIRRAGSVPMLACTRAVPRLPQAMRGGAVAALGTLEYARAPRARRGEYVEVCISSDADARGPE